MMLGNLTIQEIEKRVGVTFPIELVELLEKTKQESASNIQEGKWHCFDIPFTMVCGDKKIAQEIYDYLRPMASSFKQQLGISISGKG